MQNDFKGAIHHVREADENFKGAIFHVRNIDGGGGGSVDYTKVVSKTNSMPVAGADNANMIYLYDGVTGADYTHGCIYENVATTTPSSATATQTVGSGLSDITVDVETLESFTGWTTDNSLQIFYTDDGWSVDTTSLGVSYTGTPSVGDAITITYVTAVTTYAWTRIDVQPQPTAQDIGATVKTDRTATLTVADWSNKVQTVSVVGVTAANTIFVAPAPASAADYAAAGIVCTAQAAGTLTFECTTTPSSAITVNVVIFD